MKEEWRRRALNMTQRIKHLVVSQYHLQEEVEESGVEKENEFNKSIEFSSQNLSDNEEQLKEA